MNISVLDRNRDNFVFAQPERPVDCMGLGLNIAGKFRLSTKGVTKHAVQVRQRCRRCKYRHAVPIGRAVPSKIVKSDHVVGVCVGVSYAIWLPYSCSQGLETKVRSGV